MAITIVQHKIVTNNSTSPLAASFDTLPTVGNFVIVVTGSGAPSNYPASTTLADNQGNTYTHDGHHANFRVVIIWSAKVLTSAGTFTVTFTDGSSSATQVAIVELSGIADSPADVTTDGHAISGTPDTGLTAATAQASEIAIAAFIGSTSGADTITPNNGYTKLDEDVGAAVRPDLSTSYLILSSTGQQEETWSTLLTALWDAAIVTYKASLPPLPPGLGPEVGMPLSDMVAGTLLRY